MKKCALVKYKTCRQRKIHIALAINENKIKKLMKQYRNYSCVKEQYEKLFVDYQVYGIKILSQKTAIS